MARRTPGYLKHPKSGQARVILNGITVYLGKHGSKESVAEYDRVIQEWLLAGRVWPPPSPADAPMGASQPTVNDICDAFPTEAADGARLQVGPGRRDTLEILGMHSSVQLQNGIHPAGQSVRKMCHGTPSLHSELTEDVGWLV